MERENLSCVTAPDIWGGVKGEATSGYHREGESTDAQGRDGAARSSAEGPVMGLERRGWVIAVDWGQRVRPEEPLVQWTAAAVVRWHEPRGSSPDL